MVDICPGVFGTGVIVRGHLAWGLMSGGYLSAGICPGVFVRCIFVLEPYYGMMNDDEKKTIIEVLVKKTCNDKNNIQVVKEDRRYPKSRLK